MTAIAILVLAACAIVIVHLRTRAAEAAAEREMRHMREYLLWLEARLANASNSDFDARFALRLSDEIARVCHWLASRQGGQFSSIKMCESCGAARPS